MLGELVVLIAFLLVVAVGILFGRSIFQGAGGSSSGPMRQPGKPITRQGDLQEAAEILNRMRLGKMLTHIEYLAHRRVLERESLIYGVVLEASLSAPTNEEEASGASVGGLGTSGAPRSLGPTVSPEGLMPGSLSVSDSLLAQDSLLRQDSELLPGSLESPNELVTSQGASDSGFGVEGHGELRDVVALPPILGMPLQVAGVTGRLKKVSGAGMSQPGSGGLHPLDQRYREPELKGRVGERKRALGEMLSQFLNEKNIQWGELVSGLLIIGSATGLILSLRSELSRIIPMFPAVLFFLITLVTHLAGFYTLHRWKLPSTSRGVLWIGSLLMLVTSLAACFLADHQGPADWKDGSFLGLMGVGGVAFGAMAYWAGRSLIPGSPWLWVMACVPGALAMGWINRTARPGLPPWEMLELSGLAWLGSMVAIAVMAWQGWIAKGEPEASPEVGEWGRGRLLGTALFSGLVGHGLLWYRSFEEAGPVFAWSGPIGLGSLQLLVFGMMACAGGRRLSLPEYFSSKMGWEEGLGRTSQVLGVLGLLVSEGVAAGDTSWFMSVTWLNTLLLIALSFVLRTGVWRFLTAMALSFSGWLVLQQWRGSVREGGITLDWLMETLLHLSTSYYGTVVAMVLGGLAAWGKMRGAADGNAKMAGGPVGMLEDASGQGWRVWGGGSVLHGVAALGLAVWIGITTEDGGANRQATLLIGGYVLAMLMAARYLSSQGVAWMASVGLAVMAYCSVRSGGWWDSSQESGWEEIGRVCLQHAGFSALAWLGMRWMPAQAREMEYVPGESPAERGMLDGMVFSCLGLSAIYLRWPEGNGWLQQVWGLGLGVILVGVLGWGRRFHGVESWIWRSLAGVMASVGVVLGLMVAFPSWVVGATPLPEGFLMGLSGVLGLVGGVSGVLGRASWWGRGLEAGRRGVKQGSWTHGWMGASLGLLLYQQFYLWGHVGAYLPLRMYSWYEVLIPMGVPVLVAGWWSVGIHRGFRYLAGMLSVPFAAVAVMVGFPNGNDVEAFFYLVLCGPMLVGLISAGYRWFGEWRGWELEEGEDRLYERGMVLLGGFVLGCMLVIQVAENTQVMFSSSAGIASPAGGLLAGLIGLLTVLVALTERPGMGSLMVYRVSMWGVGHLPAWYVEWDGGKWDGSLFGWVVVVAIAMHAAMVGMLVWGGERSMRWCQWCLPASTMESRSEWRVCFRTLAILVAAPLGLFVMGCSLWVVDGVSLQVMALGVFLATLAVVLGGGSKEAEAGQVGALSLGSLRGMGIAGWQGVSLGWRWMGVLGGLAFVVLLVWSEIEDTGMELVINRLLRLNAVVVLGVVGLTWERGWRLGQAVFGRRLAEDVENSLEVARWEGVRQQVEGSAWRKGVWWGLSVVAFGLGLLSMALLADRRGGVGWPEFAGEVLVVLLALMAWSVGLIWEAVHRNGNIARLSEPFRQAYVYMAQWLVGWMGILVALVFPEWLRFQFREYWPLIALVLAMVVNWVGAWLRSRRVHVVGTPLQQTSLLAPILIVLGLSQVSSQMPADLVLGLISLYYLVLSGMRATNWASMFAGLSANAALLLFWRRIPDWNFMAHPQLWLIPPAVSLLAVSHLYRHRLRSEAIVGMRYLALCLSFCSSAGEIFLRGFGHELWPPMILVGLSLLSIFAGMVFRIRSYLYTGVSFLLLAMFAMVSHAQQSLQHTWPWWAFGITMGIAILVLFAYFEKNRAKFQELADRLRTWEG